MPGEAEQSPPGGRRSSGDPALRSPRPTLPRHLQVASAPKGNGGTSGQKQNLKSNKVNKCSRVIPEKLYTQAGRAPPQERPGLSERASTAGGVPAARGAGLRAGPQYTELFRMPQQSTMLRIISKICEEGRGARQRPEAHGGLRRRPPPGALTMMTATTMAAMPMRYSFPEKRSSIFWWQSSCRARPAGGQGAGPGPAPAARRRRVHRAQPLPGCI